MPSAIASAGEAGAIGAPSSVDGPRRDRVGAEDRPREFGAPGADQAGEAEDLARAQVEIDAVEGDRVRRLGVARGAQTAHREPHRARRVPLDRAGVELRRRPPDHHLDDRRQGDRPVARGPCGPARRPSRRMVMRSQM